MLGLSIVVVLYRKHHGESSSLCTLVAALDEMRVTGFTPTIYVWNNSPGFTPPLEHEAVVWLEGENIKLPAIYNHVARLTFEAGGELLMISDDDTDYRRFDFRKNLRVVKEFLIDAGRRESVGCFIPQVYSGGRLVSPGGRHLFKGYLLGQVESGLVDSRNLLAINSATLITRNCYERMAPIYDERLRFYGTDTDFFVRYQGFFDKIYIFDSLIEHSLSEHSSESFERALFRWEDHLYALKITFSTERFWVRWLLRFYVFYLRLKLSFKYGSLRFLDVF